LIASFCCTTRDFSMTQPRDYRCILHALANKVLAVLQEMFAV
jgi:hypothetical protein